MSHPPPLARRPRTSRADLLWCLAQHGEKRLDQFAAALGYQPGEGRADQEKSRPTQSLLQKAPAPIDPPIEAQASQPPPPSSGEPIRLFQLTHQTRLPSPPAPPVLPHWLTQPLAPPHLLADRTQPDPPKALLTPWSRLWPFLHLILAADGFRGVPDLRRLVIAIAHGKPLRRIPRQLHRTWAPQCHLLVDAAPRLLPLHSDYRQLWQQLKRLRGPNGLHLAWFRAGPEAPPEPRYRQRPRPYHPPQAGVPVLILSDLGLLEPDDPQRSAWLRLGRRMAWAGVRPVVLTPCPPQQWPKEDCLLFALIYWDRAARLPRRRDQRPAPPPPPADDGAAQLLALLAPAVWFSPALLRVVRHARPLAQVAAAAEAEVWSHPDVAASYHACALLPERRAHYLEIFRRLDDPPLQQAIERHIQHHHRFISPLLRAAEDLNLAALLGRPPQPEHLTFLHQAAATLHHHPQGEEAKELAAWSARFPHYLDPAALGGGEGILGDLWTLGHRQQLRDGVPLPLPPGLDLERHRHLFAASTTFPGDYELRQLGEELWLLPFAASPDSPLTRGSPLARLQLTTPEIRLERPTAGVTEGGVGETRYHLRPGEMFALPTPQPWLRLQAGEWDLRIEPLSPPPWASAIGRDPQGLFAEWPDGRRRYWPEPPPWASGVGWDEYGVWAEFTVQGIAQRMRWIEPGTFWMGSPESEPERESSGNDETRHQVTLTQGYWLAETTCTQALWQAVMGENPSEFQGEERPVERVSWEQVQQFLARLERVIASSAEGEGGGFRLPSEAEWEYACRAETETPFWFGAHITSEQVNYDGNYPYYGGRKGLYREQTLEVKALPCNGWGFYQMHGNVWEWCQDWLGQYPTGPVTDPPGPDRGAERVVRGGRWASFGRRCRSAYRNAFSPMEHLARLGFRLARGQSPTNQQQETASE